MEADRAESAGPAPAARNTRSASTGTALTRLLALLFALEAGWIAFQMVAPFFFSWGFSFNLLVWQIFIGVTLASCSLRLFRFGPDLWQICLGTAINSVWFGSILLAWITGGPGPDPPVAGLHVFVTLTAILLASVVATVELKRASELA